MASQVLSGASNATYTNNTGQNVRIVINYMATPSSINWAGVSATASNVSAIGRNLAFSVGLSVTGALSCNNMALLDAGTTAETSNVRLPTELMLAPGQIFTATCGVYNVVIIPEAG